MKKTFASTSGIFNPRIFGAFVLVTFGISLGVFSFAAPTSGKRNAARDNTSLVKPTVVNSTSNAVSPPVRDLPRALPKTQLADRELPPVKPNHPVPTNFVDKMVQAALSTAVMPSPMANFEGQSANDSGCGCIPPDPNGAVGPTQYVQMVNSVFSVYSKNGTRLSGPTQINSLFQTLPDTSRCHIDNNGDPIVVYDQLADRWLVSQFAVGGGTGPTSSECIAISKGPDATGEYYIYDFDLTNSNGQLFEDYPHIGLWPDAYYMSTHEFSFASGNPYQGAAAWAFERDKMLGGQPARLVYFRLGAGDPATGQTFFGGQQPSTLDGFTLPPAGSPNYFAEVDALADGARPDGAPAASVLDIWKFHVDWSNPANSTFGDNKNNPDTRTPVADFTRPNCMNDAAGCVPQLGDAAQLDPIGDRIMYRNAYRNFGDHESLVLNHTVVAAAVSGQTTQMGPRWYEFRNPGGTPVVFQQSTFGPTGMTDVLYRWMASVAMDRAGDMAIGYSTSSSANFPSIAYAGRLAGDPVSTLAQGETQLFAGGGPQHGELFAPQFGRWGDYTAMRIDPVDDCTFWYTNEYYAATDAPTGIWHTRIGSFTFPQCTPRQTGLLGGAVTDAGTGNPIAKASVTAGGYTAIAASNGAYQFSPLAPGTYAATASAPGYFSSSPTTVTVTNGGTTVQNFALTRNPSQPTPTPTPTPLPLETVNPPALTAPSGTTTNNSYTVTWSPAEVTANLASYIVEESTDYVNPLFDNADNPAAPPGQAGSLWATSSSTPNPNPWTQSPAFFHSMPFSYFGNGATNEAAGPADTSLTLLNNITIPATVGSGRLTFWSRYFNDPDDTGNVEISTDGGTTWNKLKVINISPAFPPGVPPADMRMQAYELDLSTYRGTPFKLQFRYNNGAFIYFFIRTVGWWVDDINVDGATWKQIGTTNGATTSLNITNKPGGHYYYRVRGAYMDGSGTDNSNVKDIIVNTALSLTSVVSEKTHGSAGNFDVNLPLTGTRGVECRAPGQLPGGAAGDYQLIFTFSNNLQSVASASVSHAPNTTASVGSTAMGPKPNQYTVNLTNVSNAQYLQVNLSNVTDKLGNTSSVVSSPEMGVLVGDTTANGIVNSSDISQTQSQSGQPVTAGNFREDVTVNGLINSSDISFVQSKSGTALPSSP
ncbi:MAG TPA: carboxypeptidase-like regulatory domain-containing protein [Chthoniobacterales bacterium]|nr:carboxypeptidase-like regulatory domain-containing protein [Chthoniobacterales bacterium]